MKVNPRLRIALILMLALLGGPLARAQTVSTFTEGDDLSDGLFNSDTGPTNSQLTLDFTITRSGTLQDILVWGQSGAQIGQSFQAFVLRPAGTSTNYQVVFETTNYLTVTSLGTNTFVIPGPSFGLLPGDVIAHYGRGIPFSNGTGGPSSVYIASNLPEPTNGQVIAVPGPVYPLYSDGGRNYAIQVVASTFVVTTSSDSGPGSLRQTVLSAAAVPGISTISFAPFLTGSFTSLTSGQIILSNNVTIDASGLAFGYEVDANNQSRIFEITNNATVVLNALNFAQGSDNNDHKFGGGGILNFGTLTITNCLFDDNLATNSADGGGAIDNRGALTVNNCTVEGNIAGWANGGGISSFGTLVVNNSTFTNNLANNAPIGGGGIYSPGTLTVNNSTFAGNLANRSSFGGGAIGTFGNSVILTVNNCTFTGNQANNCFNGGGGVDSQGKLTMNNCTFTANQATNSIGGGGGALYSYQGTFPFNNANNCIFFSDSAGAGTEIFNEGGSITIVNGLFGPNSATNSIANNDAGSMNLNNPVSGVDALLAPLNNYGGPTPTMPPERASPAMNAGADSVTGSLATDQRGFPRKFGSHVDIGAVEIQSVDTNSMVKTTADSGPGSLRDAAYFGSVPSITFTNTLSGQTIFLTSGEIFLQANVSLDASALPNSIQINGNGQSRLFEITNTATVVLNSLTITNGNDNNDSIYGGGGILSHGTLKVTNCVFAGNQANNSIYGGGGVLNLATLTVNNCTFTGNQANNSNYGGGGIFNDTTLTVNNCTFTGNQANNSGGGGGIDNFHTLTVNDSTFTGNQANDDGNGTAGGGILNEAASITANNCTFTGNQAGGGGGIYDYVGVTTLNNCTISGNQAVIYGGGGFYIYGSTLNLTNSIVCNNTASFGNNVFNAGTFNQGNSLVDTNALLAPLDNYGGPTQTMPPEPGSLAIDAGSDSVLSFLSTDQRGSTRKAGAHVDIGAVELQSGQAYSIVLNTADNGPGSLRQVVSNAPAGGTVTFAANLSGQSISLSGGQIVLGNNVIIDGSALATSVGIQGVNDRLFQVGSGKTVFLNSLALLNGNSTSAGGAILNEGGNLILFDCTLYNNLSQGDGGGGAIFNDANSTLSLTQCTLAGNHSKQQAGAIFNFNPATLTAVNCTIVSNLADETSSPRGGTGGGGIFNSGTMRLTNDIVAGNSDSVAANISGSFTGAGNLVSGAPILAALGNYGGTIQTMPPLSGSPAVDAGVDAVLGSLPLDQRGLPRKSGAHVDIGAVEDQIASANFGLTNIMRLGNGAIQFGLPNIAYGSFTVFATTNLQLPFNTWSNLGPVAESPAGSGNFQFSDSQAKNFGQRFYKVTSP